MLQTETLGIPSPDKYDYGHFYKLLCNSPTKTLSYTFLAVNFPELLNDPNSASLLQRNLNLRARKEGSSVSRLNLRTISYGLGIVNNELQEYSEESLESRCKIQARNDLLNHYHQIGILDNSSIESNSIEWRVLGDKALCLPNIINYGYFPTPFHVLIYNPIESTFSFEFFRSEQPLLILDRILKRGYIDKKIAKEIGILPDTFAHLIGKLNKILFGHFGKRLQRSGELVGVSFDGDYLPRHEMIKAFFDPIIRRSLADITSEIDKLSKGHCDNIIYRKDDVNSLEIFGMDQDFLSSQLGEHLPMMHKDCPCIVILKLHQNHQEYSFILELSKLAYETIKNLNTLHTTESELFFENKGNNNNFTNGKRALLKAFERLLPFGVKIEDFQPFITKPSRFPKILIDQVA